MYLGRPPWDTGASPPELMSFLDGHPPQRALDMGCGTGTNLLTMANRGWQVVGIDIAWLSILRAKIKLWQAGIKSHIIYGDVAAHLKFNDKFDFILDIGCYHSLSPNERVCYRQNLSKWLTTGGAYLLYAHLRTQPESNHGLIDEDVRALTAFLDLCWRVNNAENRPNGGGGRPATWIEFSRKKGEYIP